MGILFVLFCGASVVSVSFLFFAFYFTRSSKAMPQSFRELKWEIIWQYHGVRGLVEDAVLRRNNRVDLISKEGKVAVITGGNRGIGLRVVEKLLNCDMSVVMGVRNPQEAQENVENLIDVRSMKGKIFYEHLDTGSMQSVRKFAKFVQSKFAKVDILINNAGIMASPFKLTEDGFESQLAVNYLGHFLLTHLLLPQLKAGGTEECNSRVVNVSSCVHLIGNINFDDLHGKKYYYPPVAYNQSKLAQVLFTRYLQKALNKDASNHVQIYAVHPGVVDTDLFCHSSTTYIPWFKKLFFKTPEQGSRTITYAAISPRLEGKGGSYLSNCTLVKISSLAKDLSLGEKFFQVTCDMLGIDDFFST